MRIKEMFEHERPRERLQRSGASALSDHELLAIILEKGTTSENVIDMSHRLLSSGIGCLSEKSLSELKEIRGIGDAKAVQIKALFEFSRRCRQAKANGKAITCAKDVFDYASPKIGHLKQEHFMVILLDSKNHVIKDEIVSIGTLNASLVHPREIFKSAIRESANAIILVHNHPSGDCSPSDEDIEITDKIKKAGMTLGIKVLDSVVVGDRWRSIK